ncbi:MAG: alpha/beta hydrolase [Planctomycetes bacterium]|nr:alpha/beta hydrolase [Planctomycetota bacterium]
MNRTTTFILMLWLTGLAGMVLADFPSEEKIREEAIKLLRSVGMDKQVDAPVKVEADASGVIGIEDTGNFLIHYMIAGAAKSVDPNVEINKGIKVAPTCDKGVIVTHGWTDKAIGDWPAEIATEISKRVDPNEWICAYFDWHGGSAVINPIDAAKYARDIAGVRLAKTVIDSKLKLKHLHLIGHSAGSWTIDTAAKILAEKTDMTIHLTFLDAYVPPGWDGNELGKNKSNGWNEHYYTKDITWNATELDLSNVHNVDLSEIDPGVNEHEFPYRWYCATMTGRYGLDMWEKNAKVYFKYKDIDYGFGTSAEAGAGNWKKSMTLKQGNNAIVLSRDKTLLEILQFWKK